PQRFGTGTEHPGIEAQFALMLRYRNVATESASHAGARWFSHHSLPCEDPARHRRRMARLSLHGREPYAHDFGPSHVPRPPATQPGTIRSARPDSPGSADAAHVAAVAGAAPASP